MEDMTTWLLFISLQSCLVELVELMYCNDSAAASVSVAAPFSCLLPAGDDDCYQNLQIPCFSRQKPREPAADTTHLGEQSKPSVQPLDIWNWSRSHTATTETRWLPSIHKEQQALQQYCDKIPKQQKQ